MSAAPVADKDRIESLDVLRGFALLGILLMNIIGFGLPSTAYNNPGSWMPGAADVFVWGGIDILAEGAMRCLFSILFGAGVVLFTTGAAGKSGSLHYKRNFWLLLFGLFDAYILLWNGDILVNYALAGALLYLVRNAAPGRLLAMAVVLIVLMSMMYGGTQFGMGLAREAATVVAAAEDPETLDESVRQGAAQWESFAGDFELSEEALAAEYDARRGSYSSAFQWNVGATNNMLLFVLPLILFWDALAMMLLGMALYKYGVLQGERSTGFYWRLAIGGFAVGLVTNSFEVYRAVSHDFALLESFAYAQPTYHVGRLGMAMGYLGVILLLVHKGAWTALRRRLAAVGRMALTNYLMHSLICMLIFTGAGFALLGELTRAELYLVVVAIWILQLVLSPWWLARYRFGPLEWLWRGLTYGRWPALSHAA